MPSASLDPSSAASELATELDPVALAQLRAVAHISPTARPALDLPAMQLALDCVGQTPECLRAVVAQTGTDSLLAPSVQATGGELVVTFLYYDARGEGALRSVVRRHGGEGAHRAALDAVPGMVRELFAIAEQAPGSEPEPGVEPEPVDDAAIEPAVEPVERPFPIGPVIVGGVGVVLIGAGVGLGLAANASEKDWRAADPKTTKAVDAALEIEDRAKTQALLSNLGFVIGAAAVAAGGVWLGFELGSDEPSSSDVAVLPALAPGMAGLGVRGSL